MTANAYLLGTFRSRLSCQNFRLRINISMLISNAVSGLKSELCKTRPLFRYRIFVFVHSFNVLSHPSALRIRIRIPYS
jgi:hypothetical protein